MNKILALTLLVLSSFAYSAEQGNPPGPGDVQNSSQPNGDILFPNGSTNTSFGKYKTYMCNVATEIIDAVTTEFGETVVWQGLGEFRTDGMRFVVATNSKTNTWTMIEFFKGKYGRDLACIMATGENFSLVGSSM